MKALVVTLACAVAATVCSAALAARVGELNLKPCENQKLAPAKCGTFTVWENRAAKSGRTIDLNVIVLQATGPNRKPDPVTVLLGGPGEASTAAAEWYFEDPIRKDRDIFLMDARGTGKSNGLHCLVPENSPLQTFMPILNIEVLKACRPALEKRADLRHYLTSYAMDDLDDLRAALGYDKINLEGGSYGTRAALVYIRQHGEHVRTATLWASTALTQPIPLHFATDTERSLRNVMRDCQAEPACKAAFPNLEADYQRAVKNIETTPVRVTVKDPRNGKATEVEMHAAHFAESLRGMLYRPEAMLRVPLLLHKAAGGDYQAFADYQVERNVGLNGEIADGLYFSITCTEDIDRVDPGQVFANGRGTFLADHRARPHIEGCKGWPRGKLPAGFGEEVESDVPVLIVTGDNDPATPPAAAKAAASRLSNARVAVVPYGGHTVEGLIGEDCPRQIAARFLETADARSLDVSCLKNVRHKPFVLPPKSAGTLDLHPCQPEGIAPPVKCGTYTVWEDRAAKSGRTIDLNIVILGATGSDRQPDPVFLLSGGPGEAATNAAGDFNKDDVRKQRDVVLVDLRGTGRSNGLFCGPPNDAPLQDFMAAFDVERAKVCRKELARRADLRHYDNEASMDDLDELREALGYERINLQGWSAGTVSSLRYLGRHAQHVRSAVLLGSAPLGAAVPARFAPDAEASLRTVLKDCATDPACSKAFPSIEADYQRAVRWVREGPVSTKVRDPRNDAETTVKLDADAFAESLRAMLYDAEQTRHIPALLHRAASGDYREFAEFHLGRNVAFADLIAMGLYFSMTCTEDVARVDRKTVIAEGAGTFLADARARPHFAVCDVWPRGRLPAGSGEEVKSDVPVLIVNGELDPATPPAGARAAASRMSNARVIIVPQGGHNMNGLTGAECVTGIVNRFVETADQKSLETACVAKIRRKPFLP